jgi:hypothetical protein
VKKFNEGTSFLLKLFRFHRFHTPAMRFHARYHPVSMVSHACHQKSMHAQWFRTPAMQKPMAATVPTNSDHPRRQDAHNGFARLLRKN